MTNELNDAVKRIAELNDGNLGKINYDIIAQQAAIIEQQREALMLARKTLEWYAEDDTDSYETITAIDNVMNK